MFSLECLAVTDHIPVTQAKGKSQAEELGPHSLSQNILAKPV